ncbi:(2Fe-2S) ferredoxin domain-containing protein [Pseudonocardia parietis]|uniref:(2Fe-2S) ferredoxin n=1 Tax=Pseudonocardia parietis TaxID=570936 RepID=A0ABS4VNP4_9PSEU|nr:(2Fe-2S) ferredoxin domain-containing protein [Pseudonocardia parietis]MBP2365517.1 (2Fe-2S) ferredoxin [Pseudonocardia parietis]
MTEPARHARALVLVARPTPSGVDERSLAGLAADVAGRVRATVRVAHLDQLDPSIPAVLDELAAAGVTDVLCVPLAVPADRYLRTWIGRAVAHWRSAAAAPCEVRIAPGLTGLAADAVAGLATVEGEPITASPAGFTSPAWSVLDVPQRHLFVCRGPRCLVYGAGATHRALAAAARGTGTQVTPCGCLGPCNLGPLVVDGNTWHTHVGTAEADTLVAEHDPNAASADRHQ